MSKLKLLKVMLLSAVVALKKSQQQKQHNNSILDLAYYILLNSEKDLSNLELQTILTLTVLDFYQEYSKLPYKCGGKDYEGFNTQKFGFPVSMDVYNHFRNYGAISILIDKKEKSYNTTASPYVFYTTKEKATLKESIKKYSQMSFYDCSQLAKTVANSNLFTLL